MVIQGHVHLPWQYRTQYGLELHVYSTPADKESDLLTQALDNLRNTNDKQSWFQEFITILSEEEVYKELAKEMMEDYEGMYLTHVTTFIETTLP